MPFFRDSLVQAVGRTYHLSRDNANGSKSDAWAAGGWIVYRSGLIGDFFGVQGAFYTSQGTLFGPSDEAGDEACWFPTQGAINVIEKAYARAQNCPIRNFAAAGNW